MARLRIHQAPTVVLLDAAPGESQFDHFHIEPLRVRTVRRNWNIPAHVHHGLHQVFAIERGAVDAIIDGETLSAGAPAIVLAPSAAPHAFRFAPESAGRVLTLRPIRTFLDRAELAARLESILFEHSAILPFARSSTPWRDILRLLAVLETEHGRRADELFDTPLLVLAATLGLIARNVGDVRSREKERAPRARLFGEFERLVDHTIDRHLGAREYARRLKLSVSTLDRLSRDHAGVSAARYVRNRLYLEARRRLAYSDAAIQHIGEDLGFADPAYFSRFISRYSGGSPSALRRKLRAARDREGP